MIWSLVAASAVFWGLKLLVAGARVPAHAMVASADAAGVAGADLSRLFGATPKEAPPVAVAAALPPADARFKLLGVAAGRTGRSVPGLALIEVDGKPARAFAVGTAVDAPSGLHLLTVGHRRIELGPRDGPAQMTLELPGLAEAARSNLPPGAGPAMTSPPARAPGVMPSGAVAPMRPAPTMPSPTPAPTVPAGYATPGATMPTTPDIPPAVPQGATSPTPVPPDYTPSPGRHMMGSPRGSQTQ